jgi:translation initiation factor 2-alpha kinase 4
MVESSHTYESQYEELQLLGSGGFGSVFKVRNIKEKKLYAAKKVKLEEGTASQ